VVLKDEERVLMVHRNHGRLLRGLWEFPAAEPRAGETLQAAAERELTRLGIRRARLREGARILHTITNRRIETFIFHAHLDGRAPARRPQTRWFAPRELARLPLSAVGLRIAAGLGPNRTSTPR
jgi:adenine-specific DNA glycosylase